MRRQLHLMSSGFRRSSLRWSSRSLMVGASAACFLAPPVLLDMGAAHRAAWVLQAALAYASDYAWSGVPHWSHGADRWFSTALVCATAVSGARRKGWRRVVLAAAPPLWCLARSKSSTCPRRYAVWHTLWHMLGAAAAWHVLG